MKPEGNARMLGVASTNGSAGNGLAGPVVMAHTKAAAPPGTQSGEIAR